MQTLDQTPSFCRKLLSCLNQNARRRLVVLLILGLIAIAISKWFFTPIRISGISMEPGYRDGTFHVINRLPYLFRTPKRGEVVAIKQAETRAVWLARVIGLPGERVAIVKSQVFINGDTLTEPYLILSATIWDRDEIQLGAQQYFVAGDNQTMDQDAHELGEVEARRILGRIWL